MYVRDNFKMTTTATVKLFFDQLEDPQRPTAHWQTYVLIATDNTTAPSVIYWDALQINAATHIRVPTCEYFHRGTRDIYEEEEGFLMGDQFVERLRWELDEANDTDSIYHQTHWLNARDIIIEGYNGPTFLDKKLCWVKPFLETEQLYDIFEGMYHHDDTRVLAEFNLTPEEDERMNRNPYSNQPDQ